MINIYWKFTPACSTLAAPLNSLMAGKIHGPITLSAEESHAFQKLKDALADAALQVLPLPNTPLSILVDGSTTAAGTDLHQ